MNRLRKVFFLLFGLYLFYPSLGFSSASVEILGKIIRYDDTKVTLLREDKRGKGEVTVPKASIPKHFKIQTGQCVYSALNYEDFMSRMKKLHTKKSKMQQLQRNINN